MTASFSDFVRLFCIGISLDPIFLCSVVLAERGEHVVRRVPQRGHQATHHDRLPRTRPLPRRRPHVQHGRVCQGLPLPVRIAHEPSCQVQSMVNLHNITLSRFSRILARILYLIFIMFKIYKLAKWLSNFLTYVTRIQEDSRDIS